MQDDQTELENSMEEIEIPGEQITDKAVGELQEMHKRFKEKAKIQNSQTGLMKKKPLLPCIIIILAPISLFLPRKIKK